MIHGSSKQGKTSLRKYNLGADDHALVQCSNKWDLAGLHAAILKTIGFKITESEERSTGGKQKIRAAFSGKIFGSGGEAEASAEKTSGTRVIEKRLDIDLSDVNDIIKSLDTVGFKKIIALEDFHYLPADTQRDFSVALKAFHEASKITFIITGVWLEENRLITLNGDLTGRVVSVNADKWSEDELHQVINDGQQFLNIEFAEPFRSSIVSEASESVYIVQEACREACESAGVTRKVAGSPATVGAGLVASNVVEEIVNQQSARFNSFVINFAAGFQDTRLEMYKWILFPVLRAEISRLQRGLRFDWIRRSIQSKHPEGKGLNVGNITQALQAAASLQIKKNITPLILDYDQSNLRLDVVDRGFLLWLKYQDRDHLLENAGFDLEGLDT